jgi:hypothetical protein
MGNLAFFAAFVALPILSFLLVRSLTWTIAAVTGATALGGALVTFGLDHGYRWNMLSLQLVVLVALLAVFAAAVFLRGRREGWPTVPWRRQLTSVLLPVALGFVVIAVSRLAAAPRSGLFTAVGFFVKRQTAEDNAKWLDFAGQVVTGDDVVQGVAMGGALQLFMVVVATAMACVSLVVFGGVNEVLVAANTVVYAEFILAALAPFALAPLAEARVRSRSGSRDRGFIPAPLIWTGMLVLVVANLAASGLGHLTLEFVVVAVAFWIAVFLMGTRIPHVYALASLAVVATATIWFPLTPVSMVVLWLGAVVIVVRLAKRGSRTLALWGTAAMWLAMVVLTWSTFASTLRYMTDLGSTSAAAPGGAGPGIRAAVRIPTLDLLTSQGGTEAVAPVLGVLVVISAVLAAMFVSRQRAKDSRLKLFVAFGPVALVAGYAIILSVVGTWWAGSGPAYGAVKTTFMASAVILAVSVPLALMEIDRKKAGLTLVRVAGIAGVIYLLTVDSLMPRAFTYLSPQQWPSVASDERGYWWPAEVKSEATQTIASLPIGCAYRPQGAGAPSALPNGQTAYSCTRILVGLSGADTTAQTLVDWQRREWLTNTAAWDNEYPGLLKLPEDIRKKNLILMDVIDRVVGLDSVQSFMDRYKPAWAQDGASG